MTLPNIGPQGGFIRTSHPLERRQTSDRRGSPLQGIWAGHWMRRRRAGRRAGDMHAAGLDWHDAHWLGAALVVMLLSVADAILTITLMKHGAVEVNPVMAQLLSADGPAFAYWKVGLTAFGVVVLTAFARFRLFRVVPVGWILYLAGAGYIALVGYELNMLHRYSVEHISYWLSVPLQFPS